MLSRVPPDILRGPVGEWADFADGPGRGKRKVLDRLQCRPAFSLFATEAGEPDLIVTQGGKERLDLSSDRNNDWDRSG